MGIDNGGTFCKAVIFDAEGNKIGNAAEKLKIITPKPGFTERDMNDLWEKNCKVIKESIKNAGIKSSEIQGVACSGHGKGLYLWGKDNKPAYNGIVSTDGRAWEYPKKWNEDGTAEKVFKKTFQNILASQPVSILNWLKDNKPNVVKNIKWIFECKDYIRFKLTGEAFSEITDYSGSNLMNIKEKKFDKQLLNQFGLEDLYDALPPLKESAEYCGSVSKKASLETGLNEGTPVAGGMFDIDASAIAMDITNEDNIAVIAGTWSINEYISKKPVIDRSVMMNSLYCMSDYYLVEESSPTSAGNHSWFIDKFMGEEKIKAKKEGINIYEYCNRMASDVEAGEQNIIFLPYIFGSNYNSKAKATLIGLDSHHTKKHIIRAVMEGIVFSHLVHLEKLLKNRDKPKAIRLAGGAANSEFWVQMFSDIFQLPVELTDAEELGALGSAMAGAVVAGEYSNLEKAAKNMVKVRKRFTPDVSKKKIYRKKYELYKKVSQNVKNLWDDFSKI
jgi:L-xylulokinase